MPKSKKRLVKTTQPAEDTQKLYARAYASRLAKEVGQELDNRGRVRAPRKKRESKA